MMWQSASAVANRNAVSFTRPPGWPSVSPSATYTRTERAMSKASDARRHRDRRPGRHRSGSEPQGGARSRPCRRSAGRSWSAIARVIERHAQVAKIRRNTARHSRSHRHAPCRPARSTVLDVPMPDVNQFEFGQNGAAYRTRLACERASRAISGRARRRGRCRGGGAAERNLDRGRGHRVRRLSDASSRARPGRTSNDVFLMLCFGDDAHRALHLACRCRARRVRLITRERVGRAIRAADAALRRLGIARRRST